MQDRKVTEGAGIRVGNLELHPGLGGEIGYDSNWFLRSYHDAPAGRTYVNAAPYAPVTDAAILRITPSLSLSTLGSQRLGNAQTTPPRVTFQGGISGTYREFFGSSDRAANTDIRSQRNVSLAADARLDINPGRPIGLGIYGNYSRLIRPSAVADPNLAFTSDNITGGAEVIAMPGGGAFDIRAGYQFMGMFFEQGNGVPYTNLTHQLSVRNRWKFRPRTALFQTTTLQFVSYPNASRSTYYLNGLTPLTTSIGVTGLVTERFGALLSGGYSGTFFENPAAVTTQQYDSFNAQAEGTFYLSQGGGSGSPGEATLLLSTLTLGYSRNFQRSFLGNFYTSNKGYGRLVYFFGGTTLLQLDGYFEGQSYPQPYFNTASGAQEAVRGGNGAPTGDFTNFRVGGVLFGEYRFSNSFGINTTFDYSQTISDTVLAAVAGPNPSNAFYDLSWRRFQALLGVRWFL